MPHPLGEEPEKFCKHCGVQFRRRRFSGRLQDLGAFKRTKFCSLRCASTRVRPESWSTYHWRARRLRKSSCEGCGSTERLHAHHVDGKPQNNEDSNIQTLCVFCHNFLHATAERLGWIQPGRLPPLRVLPDSKPSGMPSSRKSSKSSAAPSSPLT